MTQAAPKSTTDASTTNSTTTTSNSRDNFNNLGLTGQNAVDALNNLTNAYNAFGTNSYNGLSTVVAAGVNQTNRGFEFTQNTVGANVTLTDRTGARVENTLANIINATSDFSQRAIAASTGQKTEIRNVPAAGGLGIATDISGGEDSNSNLMVWLTVAGIALYALSGK